MNTSSISPNRNSILSVLLALLLSVPAGLGAAVLYVDAGSPSPAPPYNDWASAAHVIQDAVDAASAGDEIVVTNGVYATGGGIVSPYSLTNRLVVHKPLTVRSVNGPEFTIIEGFQVPGTTNGDSAVRCVYLTNGASLFGFTLTNGATRDAGDNSRERSGGGVWCASGTASIVSNCVIVGNVASYVGGGSSAGVVKMCRITGNRAFGSGGGASASRLTNCVVAANWAGDFGGGMSGGTAVNCLFTGNAAVTMGGGASATMLYNCTLTGNSAASGGGTRSGTLYNCLVYFNTGGNYLNDTLNCCCTTPLPSGGTNNINADPQLASATRPSANSPCRGAGSAAFARGVDIDNEAWLTPPSIGCDEYHAGSPLGPLAVGLTASQTTTAVGYPVSLTASIEGRASASVWEFGDGLTASNQPWTSHVWSTPGDYALALRAYNDSNPGGVSATGLIHVVTPPVHYVAANSPSPVSPFTSWATAASTIQEAVDAATVFGSVVLVSNGVYATGGRPVYGALSNRVAVTKPLALRSVNGPLFTVIQGAHPPGTNVGDGAIRCVYLASGANLSGFTLKDGATRSTGDSREQYGGGVWCEVVATPISNCVFTGNAAFRHGGGAYLGALTDCTLSNNVADLGGGAASGTLDRCTLRNNTADFGGGAFMATLNYSTLTGNTATGGGAADSSTLINCLVTGNTAEEGGGTWGSTLTNCTVVGNSATGSGGGGFYSTLWNCIVYFNTAATNGPNYSNPSASFRLNYCCTTPLPTNGVGNITNAPLFVNLAGGDLHLQAGSPTVNAGDNASAGGTTDLDGKPRIGGATVDMGAYEFQETGPTAFQAWLQQYGLPTDGSADFVDSDADGFNNWQEWRCQTNPTNALSALRLISASRSGADVQVTWQSAAGVDYLVERSTGLATTPPFTLRAAAIPGQAGRTTFTDSNAASLTPLFYRVGVGQ